MKRGPSSTSRRRWPALWARHVCLLGLAGTVALAAGCGGGGSAAPSAPAPRTAPAGAPPASSHAAPAAPAASGSLQPVTIGISNPDITYAYLYVARSMGFFRQHGLDVHITVLRGSTSTSSALVSGGVQFTGTVGDIGEAAAQGLPLRTILIALNHPLLFLVGGKGVTAIPQLAGKAVVSIGGPASNVTAVGEELLANGGLPSGKYRFEFASGGVLPEVAMVEKGLVGAAVLNITGALLLQQHGYHVLASTLQSVYAPDSGLSTSTAEMQQHPQVVRGMVAATLQALAVLHNPADGPRLVRILTPAIHLPKALASTIIKDVAPVWNVSGRPAPQSLSFERSKLTSELKGKTVPPMSRIYNLSFLPKAGGGASAG